MAYARKVKGVSWNFLQFLWSGLARVQNIKANGDTVRALEALTDLVLGCPRDMKNEAGFKDEALMIKESMRKIATGELEIIQKENDLFRRNRLKSNMLQQYCKIKYPVFYDKLTTYLDASGYMIIGTDYDEGTSHTVPKSKRSY